MKWLFIMLLLVGCNTKINNGFTVVGGYSTCQKLIFDVNKTYKLTECNNNVKEILNATNIIIYQQDN